MRATWKRRWPLRQRAVIVPADWVSIGQATAEARTSGKVLLRAQNPRLAFALAAEELRRSRLAARWFCARLGHRRSVCRGASHGERRTNWWWCGAGARIGARTRLGPGCIIGPGVVIGEDCDLVARVDCLCGHEPWQTGSLPRQEPSSAVTALALSLTRPPDAIHKFPQIGRLEIGNDVEIGANTTVDRGALDATEIADGVKIDNLVQVGTTFI